MTSELAKLHRRHHNWALVAERHAAAILESETRTGQQIDHSSRCIDLVITGRRRDRRRCRHQRCVGLCGVEFADVHAPSRIDARLPRDRYYRGGALHGTAWTIERCDESITVCRQLPPAEELAFAIEYASQQVPFHCAPF